MKLYKFVPCGRLRSSEVAAEDDDGAAKAAATERLTRASSFPQRRTPSAHWRPTLGAISEDGALGSASSSALATTGGDGGGGGSRAKRSTEGRCGRTARIRPRKPKDNLRYVGIALPAFTPTAFMF
ncbi:hypothetical protein QJS04_geneDACA003259 [Acorus gramineus]|uniref:Uncharacterized protein n=1 Tax=Acorus gramineus TaxID=55184 RepID=A0AAV9BU43_ACOGR|nr:hypothetical protein QJS04_geneDACA003259 [Acorus gramineus]